VSWGGSTFPAAWPIVKRLAKICVTEEKGFLGAGALQLAPKVSYLKRLPWETEAWKGLIAKARPGTLASPRPPPTSQHGSHSGSQMRRAPARAHGKRSRNQRRCSEVQRRAVDNAPRRLPDRGTLR
jgi:hypothetical protein